MNDVKVLSKFQNGIEWTSKRAVTGLITTLHEVLSHGHTRERPLTVVFFKDYIALIGFETKEEAISFYARNNDSFRELPAPSSVGEVYIYTDFQWFGTCEVYVSKQAGIGLVSDIIMLAEDMVLSCDIDFITDADWTEGIEPSLMKDAVVISVSSDSSLSIDVFSDVMNGMMKDMDGIMDVRLISTDCSCKDSAVYWRGLEVGKARISNERIPYEESL